MPETWWKEMTAALDALADVPPPADREAVREEYLRRVIPEFTGHQVDDVTWTTAHGDLHYGNVTRGPHILDWEGWGRAPYGYDSATLYVYALLTPETAAHIRTQLAPVLDRPEARTGLLTVCAQVLQAQDRVDFYAELADPVREHLAHL
ncbi:phosphotransferase [Streptomyces virginiae]|uniref:phosphotransferase n=1 Tax=Streptomyces virginiae TaxID=1961 RepID=UPI0036511BD4